VRRFRSDDKQSDGYKKNAAKKIELKSVIGIQFTMMSDRCSKDWHKEKCNYLNNYIEYFSGLKYLLVLNSTEKLK
jgi:hypothetical protein